MTLAVKNKRPIRQANTRQLDANEYGLTFVAKMYLKLLWLVVIASSALGAEQFLSQLYGLHGRNHVRLCLRAAGGRRARACDGALLNGEWLAVRARCLRQHPPRHALALRLTHHEDCHDIEHGYSSVRSRSVQEYYYHPWSDLALVLLDRPYVFLDTHPNTTVVAVQKEFSKHGQWRWIRAYMKASALARNDVHHYNQMYHRMMTTRSPMLMFLLAIFMPSVIFTIVVMYFLFYSDSDDKSYKKLQYTKKATKV